MVDKYTLCGKILKRVQYWATEKRQGLPFDSKQSHRLYAPLYIVSSHGCVYYLRKLLADKRIDTDGEGFDENIVDKTIARCVKNGHFSILLSLFNDGRIGPRFRKFWFSKSL